MGSPSSHRKRAAASPDGREPGQIRSPSKRGCFPEAGPAAGAALVGQGGSARLHAVCDAVADEGATYLHGDSVYDETEVCAPIRFPPAKTVEMTTISEANAQAWIDMTCAKIISDCEEMLRCTVMVESLAPCPDGSWALFGSRLHSRFEDEDAAALMRARDALNARIRGHAMFRNVFKHLFNTTPKDQKKGMELLDVITLEASTEERIQADKKGKAPMFAIKGTGKKLENRRTYHEGFMLAGAAAFTGQVVHVRSVIDNGLLSEGEALQSNSFLRVFIQCPHKVVMKT